MIVTMASETAAARDHAPTTLDHNAEKSAGRVGGRRLQTSIAVKSSVAPMSSTTQQRQHSPNRRRKSMLFGGQQNIKDIYFWVGRLPDIRR
jgi:hypothetical protein